MLDRAGNFDISLLPDPEQPTATDPNEPFTTTGGFG
jgi:hypothetical protein